MNKDSKLLAEAYGRVVKQMTPQQEAVYSKYKSFGWDFEAWEGDNVIMKRWDRGMDSARVLAELEIRPDGEHQKL